MFSEKQKFLLKNARAGGKLAPSQRKEEARMMHAAMNCMNTARFAQASCACFACSENSSIMIILDAVLASIFALISVLSIRLSILESRNLTSFQSLPQVA